MIDRNSLGPRQEAWVRDLETTGLPQVKRELGRAGGFCCLGRACEVAISLGLDVKKSIGLRGQMMYDQKASVLPLSVRDFYGLRTDEGSGLSGMNDSGKSFKEIALFIRAHPTIYFIEPM